MEWIGGFTKVWFTKSGNDDEYTKDKDAFIYTIRNKFATNDEQYKPTIYPIKPTETYQALY